MTNNDKKQEYLKNKILTTPATFILTSPCRMTLFEFAQNLAISVFSQLGVKNIENKIKQNLAPDFIVIDPQKQQILVEDIDPIITILNYAPIDSTHRIIVIKDAHRFNKTTANRLLKSMEEPPNGTSFILLTNNIHGLLPTIRSRGEIIRILPPSKEELLSYANIDNNLFDSLFKLSDKNKARLSFYIEHKEIILKLAKFIENTPRHFIDTETLAKELSEISQHNIDKQEHILYAIIKTIPSTQYNLRKKVLEIFKGMYNNTKDILIYESILLEIEKHNEESKRI